MRYAVFFFEVTMSYVLAIDVGTSFTAAALMKPVERVGPTEPSASGAAPRPAILPLGLHSNAVPSVVYFAEDGRVLVGEAAERRGLDDPARMVREFKRRIGDSVPIAAGDSWLAPEEVFAHMARWVVNRAEEREGGPASALVLTHPASWGGHRTAVVREALAQAGLPEVTLISEPEAAALHYASQTRVEDGSTIAVYDLGGGTFDTAILRKVAAGDFRLLGDPDGIETLGGADFDAAVVRHVVDYLGGTVAALDPEAPETLAGLSRLRRECREAKEALSADNEATISVSLPGTQQSIRIVRSEFEDLIEAPVRSTVEALEGSLERMGLAPEDLSAVLLIGGSSRIPLVAELISAGLGRPIAVDADPKSSICLGAAAAVAGALGLGAASSQEESPTAAGPVAAAVQARGTQETKRSEFPVGGTAQHLFARAHAPGHRTHPAAGRHAPRSRVKMTAAAAAAATVLTVATATAAQSPDGSGLLASVFGAQAADVIRDGGTPAGGQQAAQAPAGGTDSVPATGRPASGLEASARSGAARTGATRPQTPTRQGTSGSGAGSAGSGTGTAAGAGSAAGPAGTTTGSGTGTGTGAGTGAGTGGTATDGTGGTTPGTGTPAPDPGTTPTTPGGAASGPTPDPTTPTVPTTPPVVNDPTTPPVVTDPVTPPPTGPTTPPATEPPAPAPEPPATQDPVPDPAPTITESSPGPDPALTPGA
ncbi:Hsp70 family protein [Paenarthrobacter sp. NyZ202]|uniref:Hsp70 family protein n=1 Tax=Paenarthrobacter sp. NyZ202 TaxID=3402689 RepID=UPI003CF320CB